MEKSLSFQDIVLVHNQSILKSRQEADISRTVKGIRLESPVILSNMPCVQNDKILNIFNQRKWPYVYHRQGGHEDILNFVEKINNENWHLKSISVGVSNADRELLQHIKYKKWKLDWITIDVALIYNIHFGEYIKWVRDAFPEAYLIAGNFTVKETVDWLSELGVDCCKQNVGSSRLCRTRQFSGFGTATITDLKEASGEAKFCGVDIISDGGLSVLDEETGEIAFGDIFKALNFGADWIMSSALFRWCEELSSPSGHIEQYGNSTARAKGYDRNIEGAVKSFKTNGKTIDYRMNEIEQNLQSSISYAGIKSISEAYNSCKYRVV